MVLFYMQRIYIVQGKFSYNGVKYYKNCADSVAIFVP